MDFLLIKKSNKNQKNLKIKNLGKSKKSKKGSKIENLKILKVRNGCQNYDDTFLFMRGLFLHKWTPCWEWIPDPISSLLLTSLSIFFSHPKLFFFYIYWKTSSHPDKYKLGRLFWSNLSREGIYPMWKR